MRSLTLFGAFVLCAMAHAQNWALLNPAYKYNYSDDGADTISNQIFVTHIDTLGVDSFRYELNRIGVECDTCLDLFGDPCNSCAWFDQPQFLQRAAIAANGNWLFVDPDTFLIRANEQAGVAWPFSLDGSITASASIATEAMTFGAADSVRTITTSDGREFTLSKQFGIVHHTLGAGEMFDLIGIHGPDVGTLIPGALDFFDFQPGDVLVYKISAATYDGNTWVVYDLWRKLILTERLEVLGGVQYIYYLYRLGYIPTSFIPAWLDPQQTFVWTITQDMLHEALPAIYSYPGEAVRGDCMQVSNYSPYGLMLHSVEPSGRYHISPFNRSSQNEDISYFDVDNPLPPISGMHQLSGIGGAPILTQGLGMTHGGYTSNFEGFCMVDLIGAVIQGDTIGSMLDLLPLAGPFMSAQDLDRAGLAVLPNPASDYLQVNCQEPSMTCTIRDYNGRIVMVHRFSSSNETIDIQALQPGAYLLVIDGFAPERFMIVR